MIANDAELEVVRKQVAHLDAAIEDMRKNILPKNERMYNLFAEAPLEMRQSLQADIDAYLARTTVPRTETTAKSETPESPSVDRV